MFAQGNPAPNFIVGSGSKAQAGRNSSRRFLSDLSAQENSLLNQNMNSAERSSQKQLKQTTLFQSGSLKKPKLDRLYEEKPTSSYSTATKATPNHPTLNVTNKIEYFLLPNPKAQTNAQKSFKENFANNSKMNYKETLSKASSQEVEDLKAFMSSEGRDLRALIGQVDFAIKIQKLYPQVNAIWEIYGKLINILPGKLKNEKILFLRNGDSGRGPVMQAVFFDFEGECEDLRISDQIKVVGKMMTSTRLKCFRIDHLNLQDLEGANFSRLENIILFTLAQQFGTNKNKSEKN